MDNRRTSHHNSETQNQCLVGNSPAIQQVREHIRQAVDANIDTIFITGETGTGKEVVAQEIHSQASSEEQPFIAVNCSALPESLAESELFNHVTGSYGHFKKTNGIAAELQKNSASPILLSAIGWSG